MAKDLMDESKVWLKYFYNNEKWEDNPSIRYSGREIELEVIEFLNEFFHFLIEGEMLHMESIIWLKSHENSVKNAFDFYNNQVREINRLNIRTVQNKIQSDKIKLTKTFGDDLIFNLLTYPEKYMSNAEEKLAEAQRLNMNDKPYKRAMVVRLPDNHICKEVDEFTWLKLSQLIETYSRRKIALIQSGEDKEVTKEMVGYYNYLISSKKLKNEDKERLAILNSILGVDIK